MGPAVEWWELDTLWSNKSHVRILGQQFFGARILGGYRLLNAQVNVGECALMIARKGISRGTRRLAQTTFTLKKKEYYKHPISTCLQCIYIYIYMILQLYLVLLMVILGIFGQNIWQLSNWVLPNASRSTCLLMSLALFSSTNSPSHLLFELPHYIIIHAQTFKLLLWFRRFIFVVGIVVIHAFADMGGGWVIYIMVIKLSSRHSFVFSTPCNISISISWY